MRDLIRIGDASRIFGVSEQTLRNWDKAGKLKAQRHPINGYRLYRVGDLHSLIGALDARPNALEAEEPQLRLPLASTSSRGAATDELEPCHWSLSVALDPKHRPQRWNAPASTVRRDWRKYPQEAHVVDERGERYRRLSPDEIALLQGIDPETFSGLDLTDRERIACIGDAVPPPLAAAVHSSIVECVNLRVPTSLEVCAGIGGMASGAAAAGLEHVALVEMSDVCGRVLRNGRSWSADAVHITDVKAFPFEKFRDQVGVLSGGPPCQPWSRSGLRRGALDDRDLLGYLPDVVADVRPEAVIFENVPGLLAPENFSYLEWLIHRYRHPARGLRYSVMVGEVNAADFGVPQVRRRIFLLGIKEGTGQQASLCFDRIAGRATHRDPKLSDANRRPWSRVGDALEGRRDPGGWRRWIGSSWSDLA